jgi:hypothetical protein
MAAMTGIVIWAAVATLSAIASGFIAAWKNRNVSAWAAWAFLIPPALLVLLLLPRNPGISYRPPTLDEEDREAEVH